MMIMMMMMMMIRTGIYTVSPKKCAFLPRDAYA